MLAPGYTAGQRHRAKLWVGRLYLCWRLAIQLVGDIEPGSGWVGSAYVGTWLYSHLALRALGGPLLSGEREAASRHSANIEFLRTEKVLAQLSAESRVLSAGYLAQSTRYRESRKYLCNRESRARY